MEPELQQPDPLDDSQLVVIPSEQPSPAAAAAAVPSLVLFSPYFPAKLQQQQQQPSLTVESSAFAPEVVAMLNQPAVLAALMAKPDLGSMFALLAAQTPPAVLQVPFRQRLFFLILTPCFQSVLAPYLQPAPTTSLPSFTSASPTPHPDIHVPTCVSTVQTVSTDLLQTVSASSYSTTRPEFDGTTGQPAHHRNDAKNRPCPFFKSPQGCKKGERCNMKHT